MATNLGGEENESDSTMGGDNELASNEKSDGSKFGEDGNLWLLEVNDWQQYYNHDERHRLLAILFFGTNG